MHHPHMGRCDAPTINEMTMNYGIKIILLLTAVLPGTWQASAQEVKDTTGTFVFTTVIEQHRQSEQLLDVAWLNPAMKPLQHRHSLSQVVAKFAHSKQSASLDVQQGDKQLVWSFDASSYVHHGNGTLWGRAYYDNGGIYHMNWNETSDRQLVYPYLLADSVGGHRMNVERYSFMGGYAHNTGRLLLGASLGYTAGLYYRNVDPRPRNVTANLDVDAGIGWLASRGQYVIAAALRFKKYKQTNDVTFYSELGNEKLYHLTGFANSYTRFDGTGYSTYYKGYRWGAVLNVHPTTCRGLSAAVELSRFNFEKILTAYNKLPLAQAKHNEIRAELAWLAQRWQVKAHVHASRRVGTENVFGDPAASVYRQIGALDMFFENRFGAGLAAVWEPQLGAGRWSVGVQPSLGYEHCNAIYLDPASRWLVDHMVAGIDAKVMNRVGSRLLWSMNAWFKAVCPVKSTLLLGNVSSELEGLKRVVENGYDRDSRHHNCVGGELAFYYRPVMIRNLAIKLSLEAQHGTFAHSQSRDEVLATLGVCF